MGSQKVGQTTADLEQHGFALWGSTYKGIFFFLKEFYCFHLVHGLGEGSRVVR